AAGAIAGNAAQNGSGGALLVLSGFVVATWIKKKRIPAWMIAGWLGTALGLAAVVLAPGNSIRGENYTVDGVSRLRMLASQFEILMMRQFEEMDWLLVIVAVLLVTYLSLRKRNWHVALTACLLVAAGFA